MFDSNARLEVLLSCLYPISNDDHDIYTDSSESSEDQVSKTSANPAGSPTLASFSANIFRLNDAGCSKPWSTFLSHVEHMQANQVGEDLNA